MSRFKFNTIGLFTTDNQKMVDFYCNIFCFETSWNGMDIDVEMHLGDISNLKVPNQRLEGFLSVRIGNK